MAKKYRAPMTLWEKVSVLLAALGPLIALLGVWLFLR